MTDLNLIKQIEKELDVKLEQVDKLELEKGYILNPKKQVTGLGLYKCTIGNLGRIISPLSALTNLTQLELMGIQLSDISPLSALTNLTQLNLGSNKVNNLSPLNALTNLTQLDLALNELSDISPLSALVNLTKLNLSNNQLVDIAPLKGLKNLKELFLGEILHCTGNGFLSIGSNSNNIIDICNLKKLKDLEILDLASNRISDVSALENLKKLKIIFLQKNKIKDISFLEDSKNLTKVLLQKNPIEVLPSWITDLKMDIKWKKYHPSDFFISGFHEQSIDLYDNPLKSPPPEIVKQGKVAIRNYFEQLKAQEEDYLFEAKMLIVGEPGAGKTSLAWKMENPNCALPREDETTKGVDVRQYYFPLQKEDFAAFPHPEILADRKFRVNLWDFGGQEVYKATHRFFLSKRSLYVLVADSRNEDTDFNYWLHIVEMFGGDSPLLIVLNEKHQREREIDIPAMRERFTNISQVLAVDFAEADNTRLSALRMAVKYFVSQLRHIGSPVPAKWMVVREAMERYEENTISLEKYLVICGDNGITKSEDALVLSQYFHDIGVFLHFQDDALLNKTIFLKPKWATNAVYKILDHELLGKKKGRFNKEDAGKIWSETEYTLFRDELLRLMQKFFLTYQVDHSGEYIAPERLPPARPKYDWDARDNLLLQYRYDVFMPKGIMSQLIVKMHRYIGNHDHVWRRGVALRRDDATAEIVETYDARAIKIRISGRNQRDFMTIINEQLDQINAQYEKMKVDKLIPCHCRECKTAETPHFFEFKDLKRRIEKNRREVECGRSYEMVNVRGLIDDVINPALPDDIGMEFIEERKVGQTKMPERNKVFVSYSHKDKDWLEKTQTHLRVLENLGITVNLWDDTQIKSGMKWREEIEKALSAAKVAVLLVSTDFLASEFIRANELPPLLKAAEHDGATILPLILKPCLFSMHKGLAEFQAVNSPTTPLSKLTENEQDEILVELAARIVELGSSQK